MFTITIGRENTACPSLSERIYDEISEAVRRGKTNSSTWWSIRPRPLSPRAT